MSLLMFQHVPDQGFTILTDTLVMGQGNTEPARFASKAVVIPHLGTVIAGTGIQQIVTKWTFSVLFETLCLDFDDLAVYAERYLPGIANEVMPNPEGHPFGGSTTLYHFGWSPSEQCYVRDTFRRSDGFRQERCLAGGFGFKPNERSLEDYGTSPDTIEKWLDWARMLRSEQEAKEAAAERIHIGGQLTWITMEDRQITVHQAAEFTDAAEMYERMVENRNRWVSADPPAPA